MKFSLAVLLLAVVGLASSQDCPAGAASATAWSSLYGSATSTSDITIPSGTVVLLDQDIAVRSISIEGSLLLQDGTDRTIDTHYIRVESTGSLLIGDDECPVLSSLVVTFLGDRATALACGSDPSGAECIGTDALGVNLGASGLVVVEGGTLAVYGDEPKLTWTTLAADAAAGTNSLTVSDTLDAHWAVGAEVVVMGSDFVRAASLDESYADYNERFTIASVGATTLTLSGDLAYDHSGDHSVMKAEVGLLSRNIVFQGASAGVSYTIGEDSETIDADAAFGGHVMIRKAADVQIHGAKFLHMGQLGILGRYPLHFHIAEESGANFIATGNSFVDSFSRVMTIHDTDGVTFSNNVAVNTFGHMFFQEDGPEEDCVIEDNLGAGAFPVLSQAQALVPSDIDPSIYWLTHPKNTVDRNHAAGPGFHGFWLAYSETAIGSSAAKYADDITMRPFHYPVLSFTDNQAHGLVNGLWGDEAPQADGGVGGVFVPCDAPFPANPEDECENPTTTSLNGFVGWNNILGAWVRAVQYEYVDFRMYNNVVGISHPDGPQHIKNAYIEGWSGSQPTNAPAPGDNEKSFTVHAGVQHYDDAGPLLISDSTFVGFSDLTASDGRPTYGAGAQTNFANAQFPMAPRDAERGNTYTDSNVAFIQSHALSGRTYATRDEDGSSTGSAGGWVLSGELFYGVSTYTTADTRTCTRDEARFFTLCSSAGDEIFTLMNVFAEGEGEEDEDEGEEDEEDRRRRLQDAGADLTTPTKGSYHVIKFGWTEGAGDALSMVRPEDNEDEDEDDDEDDDEDEDECDRRRRLNKKMRKKINRHLVSRSHKSSKSSKSSKKLSSKKHASRRLQEEEDEEGGEGFRIMHAQVLTGAGYALVPGFDVASAPGGTIVIQSDPLPAGRWYVLALPYADTAEYDFAVADGEDATYTEVGSAAELAAHTFFRDGSWLYVRIDGFSTEEVSYFGYTYPVEAGFAFISATCRTGTCTPRCSTPAECYDLTGLTVPADLGTGGGSSGGSGGSVTPPAPTPPAGEFAAYVAHDSGDRRLRGALRSPSARRLAMRDVGYVSFRSGGSKKLAWSWEMNDGLELSRIQIKCTGLPAVKTIVSRSSGPIPASGTKWVGSRYQWRALNGRCFARVVFTDGQTYDTDTIEQV